VSGGYSEINDGCVKDESIFGSATGLHSIPNDGLLLNHRQDLEGDSQPHSTTLAKELTIDVGSLDKYPRNREDMRLHEATAWTYYGSRLLGKMMRILLWFLMLVSIPRVVHAQADCVTLNSFFPDQASITGCYQESGITCVSDRITEMFVFHFNILVFLVCAPLLALSLDILLI
jgi:hypothetical protein